MGARHEWCVGWYPRKCRVGKKNHVLNGASAQTEELGEWREAETRIRLDAEQSQSMTSRPMTPLVAQRLRANLIRRPTIF